MPNGKKRKGEKGTKPMNGPPAPRFPLPQDSRILAEAIWQQAQNIGLLFNKFVWIWDDDWTLEGKFKEGKRERSVKSWFLERVEAIACSFPLDAYRAFIARQVKMIESLVITVMKPLSSASGLMHGSFPDLAEHIQWKLDSLFIPFMGFHICREAG